MRLVLPLAITLAACSGGTRPATTVDNTGAGTGTATDPGGGATKTIGPVTLLGFENGDYACYVDYRDAAGADQSVPGSFELCPGSSEDASALIGQSVTMTLEPQST